tara:strand:- start:574 stop:978 length:405 start_codon:yes stop_codon:yes gene_type:complete
MAVITGSEGVCSLTADHFALFNTWSATFSRVVSDITPFGSAGVQRTLGIQDVQGSAGGFMETGNATGKNPGVGTALNAATPTVADITLTASAGNHWAFGAIIDQISVSSTVNGDATVSFNFLMSDADAVVETWD